MGGEPGAGRTDAVLRALSLSSCPILPMSARVSDRVLRVVVIDDNADLRALLGMTLFARGGFEVVGEAGDGREGVEVVAATVPDLVILDREMPVAGGLEVLPELRALCPQAMIVLFTASADAKVREAATAAGADAIREKLHQPLDDLLDELADVLLSAAPGRPEVQVRVGPVAADAAGVWVENTTKLVDALFDHPDELPAGVDLGVLRLLTRFLDEWRTVASAGGEFRWSAAAAPATVEQLVGAWARIDELPDDAMARLGCQWSPPEAKPFFDALSTAVVDALSRVDELAPLVDSLPDDWASSSS